MVALSQRARLLAAAALGSILLLWLWFNTGRREAKTPEPVVRGKGVGETCCIRVMLYTCQQEAHKTNTC